MKKTHRYKFGAHSETVTLEQVKQILRVNPRAEIEELPKVEDLPELKGVEKGKKEKDPNK